MVRILNLLLLWMKESEFILVYVYLNSNTFSLFLKLLLPITTQKIYALMNAANPVQHKKTCHRIHDQSHENAVARLQKFSRGPFAPK